jgi:hypothetical protein
MHLFGEEELHEFEVLATQEPSINRHATKTSTYSQALGGRFHVLLNSIPSNDNNNAPRVCLFINKKTSPEPSTLTLGRCEFTACTTQALAANKGAP